MLNSFGWVADNKRPMPEAKRGRPNTVTRKAGLAPRSLLAACSLAPVTFDQDVLAVVMFPVVSNPALTPMRRLLVVAGRPGVMIAVVAVIAVLPYVSISRRWAAPFVHWRGWPDANHDLRKRCRRDQGKSEQQCQCNFFHENQVLQGWVL